MTYGIMRTKVDKLERIVDHNSKQIEDMDDHFVSFKHFEAVIGPMRRTLEMVERDVKEILKAVLKK